MTILSALILVGCGGTTPHISGYLRGNEILLIRLPIHDGKIEFISVGNDRLAVRAFQPVSAETLRNRIFVNDPVWRQITDLRTHWCQQRPGGPTPVAQEKDYEVVFQCGDPENPVHAVAPDQLPPAIQALVEQLPSTAERFVSP